MLTPPEEDDDGSVDGEYPAPIPEQPAVYEDQYGTPRWADLNDRVSGPGQAR